MLIAYVGLYLAFAAAAAREAYQGKTQLHPEIARELMNLTAGKPAAQE